jgi:hypothetical protein
MEVDSEYADVLEWVYEFEKVNLTRQRCCSHWDYGCQLQQ